LNNGLGKILQNLPPQIRENPAAIAQIMNGNPLFGLPGMPSPLIGQPMVPKPASTPCESDEDDKVKIQDVIREQSKQSPINGLLHQQVIVTHVTIFFQILSQYEKLKFSQKFKFGQNLNFGQKSKILVKNQKFWSKIENFGQKSKILVTNRKFWSKIENVGQKSKSWSKIDNFGKNRKFW